ncbi:4'-phosphopantetheinyl transferase family protein [Nocardioides plantarum]|uniref:4'-phosphopantetheinyl transferase family protein n=1 Tax=Nocardioides plantarum TaxID=29299 RepID=A0ABV5KBI0_9ACTN|nr:4'-phosphopantetheinyl transferase superfamily protein [Nocardioides plantarum]
MLEVTTVVQPGDPAAARPLAERLVATHTGRAEVRLTQTCAECGGQHGRPQVVGGGAHVGWARSAGLVAAVVADVPCAIDVESLAVLRAGPLPLDLFPPAEQAWVAAQDDRVRAFARLWVRKEVLVKLGDVSLDEALGLDLLASLTGHAVLGRTLVELDAASYDAVAAWGTDEDDSRVARS